MALQRPIVQENFRGLFRNCIDADLLLSKHRFVERLACHHLFAGILFPRFEDIQLDAQLASI